MVLIEDWSKYPVDDLKIYFYDTFLSVDQFEEQTNLTGFIVKKPTEIKMSGGVTANSYALLNYKGNYFNPKYSEALFKLHLNSKQDIIAFWGFKESLDPPTDPMIENHAGFLIMDDTVYLTTGDGVNQQKTPIVTIDVTKVYEYKIKFNKFYYKPLPQIESYLGMPTIDRVERTWRHLQTNSNYPPSDQVHYLMIYIGNSVTAQKLLYLNKVIYKEEYAD